MFTLNACPQSGGIAPNRPVMGSSAEGKPAALHSYPYN